MTDDSQKRFILQIIGVIFSLFSGGWGLVQLYNWSFTPTTDLRAHLSFGSYTVPPSLLPAIKTRIGVAEINAIDEMIHQAVPEPQSLKTQEWNSLVRDIAERLHARFAITLQELPDFYGRFVSQMNVTIKNYGSKHLTNVVFIVPYGQRALLRKPSGEHTELTPSANTSDFRIDVGNLLPSESAHITLWSASEYYLTLRETRVIHSEGVGVIEGRDSVGWLGNFLDRNFYWILAGIWVLALLINQWFFGRWPFPIRRGFS